MTKKEYTNRGSCILSDLDDLTLAEVILFFDTLAGTYGRDAKLTVEYKYDYKELLVNTLETDEEFKRRTTFNERMKMIKEDEALAVILLNKDKKLKVYEMLKKEFDK